MPATAPSTAPSTQAATRPATTRAAKITLNFKDAPLDNVLDYLSDAAGFVVSERYATWDREPWTDGGGYAVSIHRRSL